MKGVFWVVMFMFLAGCAGPMTTMKHSDGRKIECEDGAWHHGYLGYVSMHRFFEECIKGAEKVGFKKVSEK